MAVVGFAIESSSLRYSVLDGTFSSPLLLAKDKRLIIGPVKPPALMDWFETTFQEVISKHSPICVGYKLNLDPNKAQLFYSAFPWGVLNLVCHKLSIPTSDFNTRNFVPTKFGLGKNDDLFPHIDKVLGTHPPYWDQTQKYSVLAGWLTLK